jgi:hypothetical protein
MDRYGVLTDFESEVYLRNGTTIWISETSQAIRDEHGNLLYYEGTAQDITARKQAEEKIQQQLKRLNTLRMIDLAISSSFDLRLVLDIMLQQVLEQLGVDASAVLLYDPHAQTMEYAPAAGFAHMPFNTRN